MRGGDIRARTLTGWHVLGIITAFFLMVFAVNGFMAFKALSTFSGIETENAYQRGRDYNRTLEAAAAQAALGWAVEIEPRLAGADAGGGAQDAVFQVTVTDAGGGPVTGLRGNVTFWRPVVEGKDVAARIVEEQAGRYRATAALPAPGRWELRLDLVSATGAPFYLEQRVFVPAKDRAGERP